MQSNKTTDIRDSEYSSDEELDNFNPSISTSCFSRLSRLSSLKPATLKSNTPIPACASTSTSTRRGSDTSTGTVTSQTTNDSRRKTSINTCFSSSINVREYDKHDPSESVGVSESGESPYEPVNFKLDRYGKILKINDLNENSEENSLEENPSHLQEHLSDLRAHSSHLQEHTSRLQLQISTQNLNTLKKLAKSSSKTKSKPEKKVNITNLHLSTHIEGTISSLKIFDKQDCHVWFSTDNWKTFQETIAIQIQSTVSSIPPKNSGLINNLASNQSNDTPSSSDEPWNNESRNNEPRNKEPRNNNNQKTFKYKFDFIIPKTKKSNGSDKQELPNTVQFHTIIRNDHCIYLDYDFKIYVLKLKQDYQKL